ncbi:MAG: DNA-binding protein [Hymenobacter sp.]|nr:MAG: DNA-binding protein [Hymenobacter sp.]
MPSRSTIRITVHPDGRVSRIDAAAYLGLSAKTLAERQGRGLPPASVKVGGRRFYYLQELDRFIGGEV